MAKDRPPGAPPHDTGQLAHSAGREGAWIEVTKPMTEAEWLASDDPQRMLHWLRYGPLEQQAGGRPTTDRKRRLFAVACSKIFHTDDAENRQWQTWQEDNPDEDPPLTLLPSPVVAYGRNNGGLIASLLREIFGNPFVPICRDAQGRLADYSSGRYEPVRWLTATVTALAEAIYIERAFERCPILADAIEEAGCTDQAILAHLRKDTICRTCDGTGIGACPDVAAYVEVPGGCPRCGGSGQVDPHVRGCWCVDLLLARN